MFPIKKNIPLFIAFLLFSVVSFGFGTPLTIYIAKNGSDTNAGTFEKPCATIEAAFRLIKKDKNHSTVIIYYRAGFYTINKTIVIDSVITAGKKITVTSYKKEKVILSGGIQLDNSMFEKVAATDMLKRLPEAARKKVYEINLNKEGIQDYGVMQQHGFARIKNAAMELFFDEAPLTLARWPNSGMLPVGKVLDHGSATRNGEKENRGALFQYDFDRPASWKNEDIWVYGIFANGYSDDNIPVESINTSDKTIKLKQASHYAVFSSGDEKNKGKINPYRGYFFYNIPEEIDTPGEWWLDRKNGKLYVWPPSEIAEASIIISMTETPLLFLSQAINLSFKNISLGYCRGLAVYATGTNNISFENCIFLNTGTKAISLTDPIVPFKIVDDNKTKLPSDSENKFFTINNCNIYNTGTGALTISGGDRKTLTPANNKITNCRIYNYARINRASPPAIIISGTGNTVTHCEIHDGSSGAIGYSGNNHVISYNHITRVATGFNDIGAVYTGRDPSSTGTVIEYNFFESITNKPEFAVAAVYIDDGSGGITVRGNIFYKCGNSPERGFGAVHINGGHANNFINNYFIDCGKAFSNTLWDNKKWNQYIAGNEIQKRIKKDVDIESAVYTTQYPFLKEYTDSSGRNKRNNYISNSYLYNVGKFASTQNSFIVTNTFQSVDGKEISSIQLRNFELSSTPLALKNAKGWRPVPFSKIGISL